MPSIHHKLIDSTSRIDEGNGGGMLSTSCPSCGERIPETTSIYFSICCKQKYCLSCQGKYAHHNPCATENINQENDVMRLYVDHHTEKVCNRQSSFYKNVLCWNSTGTTTSGTNTTITTSESSYPTQPPTRPVLRELYGRNTSSQYDVCQVISSKKNETHHTNKNNRDHSSKENHVNSNIATSPIKLTARGHEQIDIHTFLIRRKSNKPTEGHYYELIRTSKDQTMQTKFIFKNKFRYEEKSPLEYMPEQLLNYMTAENFSGMPEVVISSKLFRKFCENKFVNTRVEYNGDDQDFLQDFLQRFAYGTIYSSVDYAVDHLNMLGSTYGFKVRSGGCTTIRCRRQLSCRFRVCFTHIFQGEQRRKLKGEKILKGLDDHPIMITKAALNHNHSI